MIVSAAVFRHLRCITTLFIREIYSSGEALSIIAFDLGHIQLTSKDTRETPDPAPQKQIGVEGNTFLVKPTLKKTKDRFAGRGKTSCRKLTYTHCILSTKYFIMEQETKYATTPSQR